MSPETIKATAQDVARKTRKPRVAIDVLTGLSLFLTLLSMIPYQLGDASTIIPPDLKGYLVVIGAIATVALQVIRPYLPSPHVSPSSNPPPEDHPEP